MGTVRSHKVIIDWGDGEFSCVMPLKKAENTVMSYRRNNPGTRALIYVEGTAEFADAVVQATT
jgi:hypothetical protein